MIKSVLPIKYADTFLAEYLTISGGRKDYKTPISFIVYILKTEDKTILVDAGCQTMPGFEMSNFVGSVNALKNNGIAPEEITDVIITHAHHDHIECVKYFKNATIHIQEDEYKVEGNKYIPDYMNVNLFKDNFILYDCVKIQRISGHSIGSSIVEFEVDGQKYVICGDECYTRKNIETKTPIGASIDINASRGFIKKYANNKYKCLLCHDMTI